MERNTENEIQDLESKESKWPWDTGIFPIIYQFITRLWQVQKRVGGAAVDVLPSHVECYRYPCELGILAIQKAKQKVEKANSWQREKSLPVFTDHLSLVRMKESVIDFFFFTVLSWQWWESDLEKTPKQALKGLLLCHFTLTPPTSSKLPGSLASVRHFRFIVEGKQHVTSCKLLQVSREGS